MHLENILTSGFHFTRDDTRLKYRYILINTMLLVGTIVALVAATIRFTLHVPDIALIDLGLAATFIAGLYQLRQKRKYFEHIVTIQLIASLIFFTGIIIILGENQTKLLWYALLIHAAFTLKGVRGGMITYGTIIALLSLLFVLPQLYPPLQSAIDLHLTTTELVMAMLFYSVLTLYALFSTQEHHKNLDNFQRANRQIALQKRKLDHQLHTFPTTGLPNSLALNEQLKKLDPAKQPALLTLSIDDYIILADEYGDVIAHRIVSESADILRIFSTDTRTLYHVSPYQFTFLDEDTTPEHASDFAKQILHYFNHHDISINGIELSISFTIGIATQKVPTLISHANTALHEAQRLGNNRYKLFVENEHREKERKNNIYWNRKIKDIVNESKLRLFYQPIVDNHTEEIVKYECLIRAEDDGKIVSPYLFLNAAKKRGILPQITRFVIDESFRHFSKSSTQFTINITEEDLRSNFLVDYLSHKSREYAIEPSQVYLEILENMTENQTHSTIKQFEKIKALGFRIAIDDFGAEASNLSRLLTYKADIIKIDAQFIKHLDIDPNSRKIVETIVSLAQKLGMQTVAEYVHNEEIYQIVKTVGIDFSQGYYLGAPQPNTFELTPKVVSPA